MGNKHAFIMPVFLYYKGFLTDKIQYFKAMLFIGQKQKE